MMICKVKKPRFLFCQNCITLDCAKGSLLDTGSRHCDCIASFLDVALPVDNEENPEAVLDGEEGEDAEGKLGGPSKTFEVAPSKSAIGRVFSTYQTKTRQVYTVVTSLQPYCKSHMQ